MNFGNGHENRSTFRTMDDVRGFVSWGIGMILGGCLLLALTIFLPFLPFLLGAIISVGVAITTTIFFAKRYAKQVVQDRANAGNEYRAMMEAGKQKKIDAMRRANSNIPDVKREE